MQHAESSQSYKEAGPDPEQIPELLDGIWR